MQKYGWDENDFQKISSGQIYLDCASRSPLPRVVEAAGHVAMSRKGLPWYGVDNDVDVDQVKMLYSKLINAHNSNCVAFAPSTSFSLSLAAKNILLTNRLKEGSKVLVIQNEMASNVYCWQNLCDTTGAILQIISRDTTQPNMSWSDAIISAIDEKVEVIAVSHTHWCDGSLIDIEAISTKLSTLSYRKPFLIIDATQSIGAIPFDIQKLQPDFVACSIHKWLCGPYGMSLMYLHPDHHNIWQPLDHHERSRLGSDDPAWDEVGAMTNTGYPLDFKPGAARIEAGGRPNPIIIPMLIASLTLINHWNPINIQSYLFSLTNMIANAIPRMKTITGLEIIPRNLRCGHIIGIRCNNSICPFSASELVALLKKEGVLLSARYGIIRVSPYVNNTRSDIERFLGILERLFVTASTCSSLRPHHSIDSSSISNSSSSNSNNDSGGGISSGKTVKVLVTGATGWLGQHLCKHIIENVLIRVKVKINANGNHDNVNNNTNNNDNYSDDDGKEVVISLCAAYNRTPPDWLPPPHVSYQLNLADETSVNNLIQEFLPDVVVHLAAISSPVACAKDPATAERINCPLYLIQALKKYVPSCVLIFTSTDLVYDGENSPYTPESFEYIESIESDIANNSASSSRINNLSPTTVYGQTKLHFEKEVLSLRNGIVLRLSNMIGPRYAYKPCGTKFLEWLQGCFVKREYIGLRHDEIRSFIDVDDVIKLIRNIIIESISLSIHENENENNTEGNMSMSMPMPIPRPLPLSLPIHGVYNVGGPCGLSRLALGDIIATANSIEFIIDENNNNINNNNSNSNSTQAKSDSNAVNNALDNNASSLLLPWRVYTTSNEESVLATGIKNPRDVTMLSQRTETRFALQFSDMNIVIKSKYNS